MYSELHKRVTDLQKKAENAPFITLSELVVTLGHDSYFFLCLFFVIPFLQPIPILGASTIVGTALAFFSALIIADQPLYIPSRFRGQRISSKKIIRCANLFFKFCKKTGSWLHPRASFLQKTAAMRKVNGLVIFISALILALPLPIPFTNTFPAWTIAIISIGSLREDTVAVFFGWLLAVATCLYLGIIILIPIKGALLLESQS